MFTQNQNFFTLTVTISGSGTVMSTDGSINCPGTCSYTYPSNMQVTLNATAGQGGTFSGWSGAVQRHRSLHCHHDQDHSVTANFTGQQDMVMHSFGTGNDGQNPLRASSAISG